MVATDGANITFYLANSSRRSSWPPPRLNIKTSCFIIMVSPLSSNRLHAQKLTQADNKEKSKFHITGHLWAESTCDQWILPHTMGQHCGMCTLSDIISSQWRHNGHDGVSNHQSHDYLLSRLFRSRLKKTSKLRVTGLCAGNSPVTGEFLAQMASNAENVSIWWRHHGVGTTHDNACNIRSIFSSLSSSYSQRIISKRFKSSMRRYCYLIL